MADVLEVYTRKLIAQGRVSAEKVQQMKDAALEVFNRAFLKAKSDDYRPPPRYPQSTRTAVLCQIMHSYITTFTDATGQR